MNKKIRSVSLNEQIPFHCRLCGGCCRHVKDSIMLEPMDVYCLARYLREQGKPVFGTETEKLHHFADGTVPVKDWLRQNFSREAREALKADYDALPLLGRNIRAMGAEAFQRRLFQFLYCRYYNYALDAPFLPQFRSNLERLKALTGGQI